GGARSAAGSRLLGGGAGDGGRAPPRPPRGGRGDGHFLRSDVVARVAAESGLVGTLSRRHRDTKLAGGIPAGLDALELHDHVGMVPAGSRSGGAAGGKRSGGWVAAAAPAPRRRTRGS